VVVKDRGGSNLQTGGQVYDASFDHVKVGTS
jgi:hypothetical protein